MIHDAVVEISCDGKGCWESVFVPLEYKFTTYSGNEGTYDDSDEAILKALNDENCEWSVIDGEHFCFECVEEMSEQQGEDLHNAEPEIDINKMGGIF